MENAQNLTPVVTKKKSASKKKLQTEGIRVRRETKKKIYGDLAKINKKDFGKKVKVDEYIALAISHITEADFTQLQEASLTNADRLERRYKEYVSKHGSISKDQFLGVMLNTAPTGIEQTGSENHANS